tara:strand:- start:19797 stop:21791 length:1995 start_codon:yes stop_codon:yes gene_type:complete
MPRSVRNKQNPKNAQSTLFKKLTRLLSGPIVNYRTQTARRLKRRQLDMYAKRFTSASGKQFKRMDYNPFAGLYGNTQNSQNRLERYVDFDQMEYTPEIASALDIYADEMTNHSFLSPLMSIDCNNEEIKGILNALYFNIMNIEYNLFGWCRTMCKYGDFFLYLDIDEVLGVKSVIGLPGQEIERLEGEDKTNPNYAQFQWNSAGLTFESWQIGHFRILGNDKYAPYGTSVLEPARRIWRQLTLLEDAMMAYRIVRSPERRVFYIDVGNIPPQDIEQYMQKVMTSMKRNQVVDPSTGRVDLRYNPMSVDEDYFVPTRANSSSRIESLAGGTMTGDIDDVKYLRDKLFAALKIPGSYLTSTNAESGAGGEDATTLAQKDIRFARTVLRLQRSVVTELEKIGIVHLYTLGFRGEDLIGFKLKLNNPSKISEIQELEHWKIKFEVASAATEGYFSRQWIASNLFNMTEEEFVKNQRQMYYDRQYDAKLEAVAEEAQAEAAEQTSVAGTAPEGVDPAAGLGGDLGTGGEGGTGIDLAGGDAAAPPPEGGDAPGGGEDTNLLAAPGSREDSYNEKHEKSKGKIHITKSMTGERDKRDTGGRNQSVKTFSGYKKLKSLSRGVVGEDNDRISESVQTNYIEEEDKIFNLSKEVTDLLDGLQNRNTKNETKAQ